MLNHRLPRICGRREIAKSQCGARFSATMHIAKPHPAMSPRVECRKRTGGTIRKRVGCDNPNRCERHGFRMDSTWCGDVLSNVDCSGLFWTACEWRLCAGSFCMRMLPVDPNHELKIDSLGGSATCGIDRCLRIGYPTAPIVAIAITAAKLSRRLLLNAAFTTRFLRRGFYDVVAAVVVSSGCNPFAPTVGDHFCRYRAVNRQRYGILSRLDVRERF